MAPITNGIIVHFRFHIRCTSIPKLFYFNFFSASFCTTFLSAGIATSISLHVFSFLFLIIISGLFAVTSLSVCTALLLLLLYLVVLQSAVCPQNFALYVLSRMSLLRWTATTDHNMTRRPENATLIQAKCTDACQMRQNALSYTCTLLSFQLFWVTNNQTQRSHS
jgi:hypothetical protein